MNSLRHLLSHGYKNKTTTALALPRTYHYTTAMPSYERVAIHRNPKYTHNGTKSYVFAMSKCE
jgi:hypothetical protein